MPTYISDLCAHGERLELCRENVKHGLAAHDCRVSAIAKGVSGNSQHVPPSGTLSSSPVPSSYLQVWGSPLGTETA
jgi:hypothetical protein